MSGTNLNSNSDPNRNINPNTDPNPAMSPATVCEINCTIILQVLSLSRFIKNVVVESCHQQIWSIIIIIIITMHLFL